jgi:hypothetical protein
LAALGIRGDIGVSEWNGEEVNMTDETHIVYFTVQEKRGYIQQVVTGKQEERTRNS